LDLIACRNLLIYLQRDIQREVIELFHYALKPGGLLLLGTSETADASELFIAVDRENSLYRKRNVPAREPRLPVFPAMRARNLAVMQHELPARAPVPFGVLHERMVERYAPPSILVSPDDRVVHLSEHAGTYLAYPGGEPTTGVLKLVRDEFRIELRTALH